MVFEECMECQSLIPLSGLRDHIRACVKSLPSDVSLFTICENYIKKKRVYIDLYTLCVIKIEWLFGSKQIVCFMDLWNLK